MKDFYKIIPLFKISYLLIFIYVDSAYGILQIELKKNNQSLKKEYANLHDQFSRELCGGGAGQKYWRLRKEFVGNGFYIPLLTRNKQIPSLDTGTINKMVPMMREKIQWIDKNIKDTKNNIKFDVLKGELNELSDDYKQLINFKTKYFNSNKAKEKESIRKKSSISLKSFKTKFISFFKKYSFLRPFRFPVDHLKMRSDYDRFKFRTDIFGIKKSNEIYFFRRLVEDGAPRLNSNKTDSSFRTTLNTVTLAFDKQKKFIEEDLRYDLNYIFNFLKFQLFEKKTYFIKRLEKWKKRVFERLDFYNSLLRNTSDNTTAASILLKNKHDARQNLKEYILRKQAVAYKFWSKQSEINQFLFVLETILYNEVGRLDQRDGLERRDVGQVVINRKSVEFYTVITPGENLYQQLISSMGKEEIKYKWLNILFKEGEFSFTYFFIPSTVRIFCPDRSKIGQNLRNENLDIALDLIRKPRKDFNAVRYFSRVSMLGRINMGILWKDFVPLPEARGKQIKDLDSNVREAINLGNYNYYYHFVSNEGTSYKVIGVGKDIFTVPFVNKNVYFYRDPNLFRYFRLK